MTTNPLVTGGWRGQTSRSSHYKLDRAATCDTYRATGQSFSHSRNLYYVSQAVLRMRQSRSRNLSKHSAEYTDDEDLGLPKSLQNSPGDFSDEMEAAPGLRTGPGWGGGGSRHHRSHY